MKSSQIKWLAIGLCGACVCSALVAALYFLGLDAVHDAFAQASPATGGAAESRTSEPEKYDARQVWEKRVADWKARTEPGRAEYERIRNLYTRISAHREIRRRLFNEADFMYSEEQLPVLFARIADPLDAHAYSDAIADLATFAFDSDPEAVRETMRKWTEALPESHYAWLVRGRMEISYAWFWRGPGFADTVSDEGLEQFRGATHRAREFLERAADIEPIDPEIWAGLVELATLQSRSRDEMESAFNRAIAIAPSHYGAYMSKFNYLRPVWYGSWPEYEAFLTTLDDRIEEVGNPLLRVVRHTAQNNMISDRELDYDHEERGRTWLEIWKACADQWPNDEFMRGRYLEVLIDQKRFDEAFEQFEWLGSRYPHRISLGIEQFHHWRIRTLLMRTLTMYDKIERDREIAHAIEIDPEYELTYRMAGAIHAEFGEFDAAEDAAIRAVELKPLDPEPHLALAWLYVKMGNGSAALESLKPLKNLKLDTNQLGRRGTLHNQALELGAAKPTTTN